MNLVYTAGKSAYPDATLLYRPTPPIYPAARAVSRAAGPLAPIPAKRLSLQSPFAPMVQLLSRFWFSLRFAWLTATVLLVLGLNQRAVSILRLPEGTGQTRLAAPPKATVVKQKVQFEATASLRHFVAPRARGLAAAGPTLAAAWLPHAAPGAGRATPAGGRSAPAKSSGPGCWPWHCRRRPPSF